MTRRVDQVDQELRTIDLLGDFLQVLLFGEAGIEGDGSRFDGDTPILLVGTGIHETSLTSLSSRNDTGTLDKRVGEGGLSVIDYLPGKPNVSIRRCRNQPAWVCTYREQ